MKNEGWLNKIAVSTPCNYNVLQSVEQLEFSIQLELIFDEQCVTSIGLKFEISTLLRLRMDRNSIIFSFFISAELMHISKQAFFTCPCSFHISNCLFVRDYISLHLSLNVSLSFVSDSGFVCFFVQPLSYSLTSI